MYNILLKMDSAKTFDMRPAELPVFKEAPACYGGYFVTWAVLKNAPHRDQAIRLLLSFNKPDISERWARYTHSPTGIKGKILSNAFGLNNFEKYQVVMDKKYGKRKFNVFNNSAFCFGREHANDSNWCVDVMEGRYTADQAIKMIKRDLKK